MRINILGASGAGVTTLGRELAIKTGYPYVDSDDFYWDNNADTAFTVRRVPDHRNQLLLTELRSHGNWIVGGPLMSWGVLEHISFDLVVFLKIPHHIRMSRLKKREHERYGDIIYHDPVRHQQYIDFLNWAAGYDDNTTPGSRTLRNQLNWLKTLTCPVLTISGDTTVETRTNRVLNLLKTTL